LLWAYTYDLLPSSVREHMGGSGLQVFALVPTGAALGALYGIAGGLLLARRRKAADWVALAGGLLAGAQSVLLAANSGSAAESVWLRLLHPGWFGAPFLWCVPLVIWGAVLLSRDKSA
jgi:hypothetical protein